MKYQFIDEDRVSRTHQVRAGRITLNLSPHFLGKSTTNRVAPATSNDPPVHSAPETHLPSGKPSSLKEARTAADRPDESNSWRRHLDPFSKIQRILLRSTRSGIVKDAPHVP